MYGTNIINLNLKLLINGTITPSRNATLTNGQPPDFDEIRVCEWDKFIFEENEYLRVEYEVEYIESIITTIDPLPNCIDTLCVLKRWLKKKKLWLKNWWWDYLY